MLEQFYRSETPPELMVPDNCEDGTCAPPLFPEAWGLLKIDVSTMSEEQRDTFYRGLDLLRGAGISFDTGVGGGYFDCELDWSLKGASLVVRLFPCYRSGCEQRGFSPAYWTVYGYTDREGAIMFPFCSEACRRQGDADHLQPVCAEADKHGDEAVEHNSCDHEKAPPYVVLTHHTAAALIRGEED